MPKITDPHDGVYCWWCGFRPWEDEHHLFRRSTSPAMVRDKENKVKLCRKCHEYATINNEVEDLFQQVFLLKQEEPELTVEHIARMMAKGDVITPRNVARYRTYLAAEFSNVNARFTQLEMHKPFVVEEFRKKDDVKSDKRAQTLYDMQPEGQEYIKLHAYLKALEKLLSALRSVHEQYIKEATMIM